MQAIIDDCLSVGLFDTYIYKEYGILTSQAIQEQYHKIITDSRRKYKLPLERFWLIKEEKDGTGNNSADIRSNINSKGTEVDEAENKIVDAGVNTTKQESISQLQKLLKQSQESARQAQTSMQQAQTSMQQAQESMLQKQ